MTPLDLQLNGYKGVDFNADDLTAPDLRQACEAVRADGGGRMLATVITDRLDRMAARIARLAALREADAVVAEVMAGIHVEGPFISPRPGFVGAHPAAHVLPAEVAAAETLVTAGRGLVRLVTLAPEHDAGLATTRWLAHRGILVSAGHCDPSADTLARAIDAGLTAFTHLGNGCPLELHRHDNVLHRVLAADGLRWVMLIPDGVHLPPPLVRTMIRVLGIDRVIAVTDATAAGGMGSGTFSLAGHDVVVDADGAAWAADRSHLVGSTASMARIRGVLRDAVGLSADEVTRLTETNPARALGDLAA
ncbi:MAG: N-acetylglucosamine-6-phosphate deacetylase [Planctomycetota bacterium]